MTAYLLMGGYWPFVWPAYALSLGAIAVMIAVTLRAWRRAKRKVSALPSDHSFSVN